MSVRHSPRLTVKPTYIGHGRHEWLCNDRTAYHLGLAEILPGDSIWVVASTVRPRHSHWQLTEVCDVVYYAMKVFMERSIRLGCHYFWLEWEEGTTRRRRIGSAPRASSRRARYTR